MMLFEFNGELTEESFSERSAGISPPQQDSHQATVQEHEGKSCSCSVGRVGRSYLDATELGRLTDVIVRAATCKLCRLLLKTAIQDNDSYAIRTTESGEHRELTVHVGLYCLLRNVRHGNRTFSTARVRISTWKLKRPPNGIPLKG